MLKNDFLEMMEQDLTTSNDNNAKAVFECFKEILKDYPNTQEIDSSKNCKDCYSKMEDEAKKKAITCFAGQNLKKFICDYLGLPELKSTFIKLEDFI